MALSPQKVQDPAQRFRDLFDRNVAWMSRTLQRFGVHRRDLEDVSQEVFLLIHRNLPTFDGACHERAWMTAFAARTAANYRRLARHRRQKFSDELEEPAPLEANTALRPDVEMEMRQRRRLVLTALRTLDLKKRVVVSMHELDGFSASEISTALHIPTNTVYSRLRSGKAEFRRALMTLTKPGDVG